ncbi:insulinase family protein [Thalassotalea sp. M1531]|uniref:Insulinase family protein n=1 Tax=Thalassotalea algicola TaxID=2716224 RepID=A0A7Y0Q5Y4_9GAMM|nr:pitrilysin family protein [Thalassotalea algicola]NMP30606.1 insulinase family protein [Thalassotalea algicola]
MKKLLLASCIAIAAAGCVSTSMQSIGSNETNTDVVAQQSAELSIPFEKYTLDNGLTIILHQDKSDPIVAISTIVHVGSNREKPGRTGFAHFFEHMAFNDSENVPQGANRKMIEELGGTRNGGTWSDGTIYYEVVPKDAFEKLMWIDSDRLGYMIKTVNEGALEREKQVVKNEKRQRVDNRPYGHTGHVIRKNLYPEDHPYNWTVIGDLEDLQAATLEDVKEFYKQYYGPSNATVVIAGDIDIAKTKELVKYWFGEISASEPVADMAPMPVSLAETKKLYHIDNFAKLPELRMTFPTVEEYSKDSYALNVLSEILSSGKRAPLYQVLVEEKQLAPSAWAYNSSQEVAGTFTLHVRAKPGIDLDAVYAGINEALARFEEKGFSDKDLDIIKAKLETKFYNGISSALDKAFQLGTYEEYAGDPAFITQDIKNIKAVTKEDVMRVYSKYISKKPFIMTSFVPKGQQELIVDGSLIANVKEEQIVAGAEKNFDSDMSVAYQKTETKNDRSEPELGDLPLIKVPEVHSYQAGNGLEILNVEHRELPLVNFKLRIEGGAWLESFDKLGTASLLSQLMNEGTKNKTPEALDDEIGLLGAGINISSDGNSIYIYGNTLARNFEQTMSLVTEMLLEPRWDQKEFDRIKASRLTTIEQNYARPDTIASNVFYKQLYGTKHRAGLPTIGTKNTVASISLDDLKHFYQNAISPMNATLNVVGDISQQEIVKSTKHLAKQWQGKAIELPEFKTPAIVKKPKVFFVDVPNAKQSVIMMGKPGLNGTDPEYYPFTVAQNRLGAGGSARLFQTLRIEKGYTYGAYSYMSQRHYDTPFIARSQVRTNVTLESLEIFKDLVGNYAETFEQSDLDTTKNLLMKQKSRYFETINNVVGMLDTISEFDLPHNYIEQQQQELQSMTLQQAKAIYNKHADEQQMIYVVVGDAKTQLNRMKSLGYGDPIVLDKDGNRL